MDGHRQLSGVTTTGGLVLGVGHRRRKTILREQLATRNWPTASCAVSPRIWPAVGSARTPAPPRILRRRGPRGTCDNEYGASSEQPLVFMRMGLASGWPQMVDRRRRDDRRGGGPVLTELGGRRARRWLCSGIVCFTVVGPLSRPDTTRSARSRVALINSAFVALACARVHRTLVPC